MTALPREEILALYDERLRGEAELWDAPELTRIGALWAGTFPKRRRGFLSHQPLEPGADVDVLVGAGVAHFQADRRVDRFEWKTRGHDALPGLARTLDEHGLRAGERETVMAGEARAAIDADRGLPPGYMVERARDEATVREGEALAGRVFEDSPWESGRMADELVASMLRDAERVAMWLVRGPRGEVVCSGRLELVSGSGFAGLWGGACDPAHRGRGLYRAVTAARARWAIEHGASLLQSDCTEYSRPILERAGLLAVTTTTPFLWRRAAD